jgi:hypothetical protein
MANTHPILINHAITSSSQIQPWQSDKPNHHQLHGNNIPSSINIMNTSISSNREDNMNTSNTMKTSSNNYLKLNFSKSNGKIQNKHQLVDSVDDDIHVGISCLRALLNNKVKEINVLGKTLPLN